MEKSEEEKFHKASKRLFDNAISVNSVHEEYIYVSKQRCECGGMLEVVRQDFSFCPFEHDILTTECEKCSKTKEFPFDVRSFFDKQAEDILFKEKDMK